MKKRYIYGLLFGIPGFFISLIISVGILGAATGILWSYFFGDSPWPASAERALSGLFVFVFLILWISSITIGFIIGKRLEEHPALNQKHVLISVGLTVMIIAFIILQQWSMGNLGPKSDSVLCADFCTQKGYSGSGMPPRNSGDRSCSCYDDSGNEALKVPLDSIDLDASR
jgi:hypothetical protein